MNLNELKIDEWANIVSVGGIGITRNHLLDMGVIPGAKLKINKYAPMGDPIEIFIHGYNLTLRLDDAKKIEVKKCENEYRYFTKCVNCANCKECDMLKNGMDNEIPSCDKYKYHYKKIEHPGIGETGHFHDKKTEKPLPSGTLLRFALVGNQNTGKTTLFNQLTGSNQHIGNFPGVTVDKKSGIIKGKTRIEVTDLPGVYSLTPYSDEEKVTRDFILKERPHCIINIVDANNIERNLNLTLQLIDLDIPVVLAINMMDEIAANGGSIDINKFEKLLGIPIVPISAYKGDGCAELVNHAGHIAKYQEKPNPVEYIKNDEKNPAVYRAINGIMHLVGDHAENASISKRYAAIKIIEGDDITQKELMLTENENDMIGHICEQLEKEGGLDRVASVANLRFSFINSVCEEVIIKPVVNKNLEFSNKVDRVLTGKWTGIPMFILIMGVIFYMTFNVIGPVLQDGLAYVIDKCSIVVDNVLAKCAVNSVIHSLVIDGIFEGVGSVLSFIPIILILFLFLSLLEDSGYMARVAFVMDKLLRKLGLSGRSIVPLIIGFGCTVPGVMATRTIPSARDRKLTILLLPFMTCTAKLPIYGFLASIFFPKMVGFIMIGLYVFAIILGIIVALITKKTFIKGDAVPFIMELPSYRMPSPINVVRLLWEKAKDFLQKAFTVIFFATIVIWFLQNFDITLNIVTDTQNSILANVSGIIAPIFAPMGLDDYRVVTSLITGFLAKESVVSTLRVLYKGALFTSFTSASALALLVFSSIYTPCVAAIAAIKREMGIGFAIWTIVFQCVLAYVVAYIVYIIC